MQNQIVLGFGLDALDILEDQGKLTGASTLQLLFVLIRLRSEFGKRTPWAYHLFMTNTPDKNNDSDPPGSKTVDKKDGISSLQVLQSTIAAALGVQSSKNRERDFTEGKASQFIIAGIIFTALFVGLMLLIVRTVLSGS